MIASSLAQAAPDITIAAIATGRLYVAGTTGAPHMPVVLEDRFRTESDETGRFQFEEVYHPARCIVGLRIDGKAYEAVVGNCGQQGPPGAVAAPRSAGTAAPIPTAPSEPAAGPARAVRPEPVAKPAPAVAAARKPVAAAVREPVRRRPPPPRPKPQRKPSAPAEDPSDPAQAPAAE